MAGIELTRSMNNNFTRIQLGDHLTLWFSYETIVAYSVTNHGTFKSENVWSNTTGRHLNSIGGRVLPHDRFNECVTVILDGLNFSLTNTLAAVTGR